ncbi:FliH/SctL family protein [Hyphomicrobium sp. MC1]|uniref:FliH/SctL family protein n=1 Tax=Hyphomicrobium sp. (strain MC1) TaxID=717785 RepID=UPI000213F231|nr:FliH/SctL family protein [Hyphomicrobium sp. MC1]CCB66710.1 protein of unknown function [Hyphomicrobium sp. MC1]
MVRLVELSVGAPGLIGPGRVVKAADAVALLEIAALREAAAQESAEQLEAANAEVINIREAARAEGREEAASELQDRLFEIAEAAATAISRVEERILELAVQVARRILGEFDQAEAAARIAARGLRLSAHSSFVRLRVAPGLVDQTNERLSEIVGTAMPLSAVQVIGDERIRDAGCVMETDAGIVDATIESQLSAIERGLRRRLSQTSGANE